MTGKELGQVEFLTVTPRIDGKKAIYKVRFANGTEGELGFDTEQRWSARKGKFIRSVHESLRGFLDQGTLKLIITDEPHPSGGRLVQIWRAGL